MRHIVGKKRHFVQKAGLFFTILLGSKGRGAPKSSRGVLGAPRACANTHRSGVSGKASDSVQTYSEADLGHTKSILWSTRGGSPYENSHTPTYFILQ